MGPAHDDTLKNLLGFHWFSPSGEMPPLLFGRKNGKHKDCATIIISHFPRDYQAGITSFSMDLHTLFSERGESV